MHFLLARFIHGNMAYYFLRFLYLAVSCSVIGWLPAEYENLDLLGDDFCYVRNAWFDSECMFCISTDAFGEFHIFSTAERTQERFPSQCDHLPVLPLEDL